ncbi:MAG: asparagine synthase (glutamine-hydrolyzing) [Rhodospirillaceae bacterium]|nr:asparagine synthase (glutamine-hydrolyzing) [Rhodospirillaceae bacterium]
MCGLAGVIVHASSVRPVLATAQAMADALVHRGPDDAGSWQDERGRIAMAHRRLSIFDLSSAGKQPMTSPDGRWVGVFNGAIYNYRDLKRDLQDAGIVFRTATDTEVLLAAVQCWGVGAALARLVGMFAFALFDTQARRLTLARDRAGQKPLYVGRIGPDIAFASELKAFMAVPGFTRRIDPAAARLYAEYGCVPAPHSIFADVQHLRPGYFADIDVDRDEPGELVQAAYWSRAAFRPVPAMSEADARRGAEALLAEAVKSQMIADVPLGAFLSGGIDSTAVVALMQEQASQPVRTFTIGSDDPVLDESAPARAVARHLGTDHTELRVNGADALAVVERLSEIYDEPLADASQIPTVLIAERARRHVTVALTGDGGDENFGGYTRHLYASRLQRLSRVLPLFARQALADIGTALPRQAWVWLEHLGGPTRLADKVGKALRGLPAGSPDELYAALVRVWSVRPLVQSTDSPPWTGGMKGEAAQRDIADVFMVLDFVGYLPNDVLTKVDRATMAVALEARAPLLDHRVVEFMAGVPAELKLRGGVSKRILREIVASRIPAALIDRPKAGFDVPIGPWLRGPLRDWAAALLDPPALNRTGMFETDAVARAWRRHQSGHADLSAELWCVLMFQAWAARYRATF